MRMRYVHRILKAENSWIACIVKGKSGEKGINSLLLLSVFRCRWEIGQAENLVFQRDQGKVITNYIERAVRSAIFSFPLPILPLLRCGFRHHRRWNLHVKISWAFPGLVRWQKRAKARTERVQNPRSGKLKMLKVFQRDFSRELLKNWFHMRKKNSLTAKRFFICDGNKWGRFEALHTFSVSPFVMDSSWRDACRRKKAAERKAEANNKNINQTSEAFGKITFNE